MGSVRVRKDTGQLFFDFTYRGVRCREQTTLPDTVANRRRMQKVMDKIEAAITLETFDYASYFPSSKNVARFREGAEATPKQVNDVPRFSGFAWEWFDQNKVQWKTSYTSSVKRVLEIYLIPAFGEHLLSAIEKGAILKFRASLAKVENKGRVGLSPDRINHIMTPLRMILEDGAGRFGFPTPFATIKPLKVPRTEVDPLTLDEVEKFLAAVRLDFRNYYVVRFFTGLRTSEIDGLKWRYVDFERREILVRETIVKGRPETVKTDGSSRSVVMSTRVYNALKQQHEETGSRGDYVFCTKTGGPLSYANVTSRVWYPTLDHLGIRRRRAYQSRHTTATLWLAAGENPEWIARQMGHTTTKMLFTVYSRFVPNLTRRDGSAFERLIGKM